MCKYREIFTPTDDVIGSLATCFLLAVVIMIGMFVLVYYCGGVR